MDNEVEAPANSLYIEAPALGGDMANSVEARGL